MTRQAFTPRLSACAIIEHVLDTPRCATWAGMGMGKSVGTLTVLDILEITEPGPALVLAPPLRVASSTWPDEAQKWAHLRNVEVSAVVGTPEKTPRCAQAAGQCLHDELRERALARRTFRRQSSRSAKWWPTRARSSSPSAFGKVACAPRRLPASHIARSIGSLN